MVDESGAQGWSQLDDQTMIDLDEQGYDGQSAWVIAAFGNEPMIAVNTDTTFSGRFAREIGVPLSKNDVYIWSETGTRELEAWLAKDGYEVVNRMGGDVPSTEAYATARFVIQAVARDMDLDEDVVEDAAKGIDWWPKDRGQGDQEIPGSTDGDTTVWAKRKEGEGSDDEVDGGVDESRRRGVREAGRRPKLETLVNVRDHGWMIVDKVAGKPEDGKPWFIAPGIGYDVNRLLVYAGNEGDASEIAEEKWPDRMGDRVARRDEEQVESSGQGTFFARGSMWVYKEVRIFTVASRVEKGTVETGGEATLKNGEKIRYK